MVFCHVVRSTKTLTTTTWIQKAATLVYKILDEDILPVIPLTRAGIRSVRLGTEPTSRLTDHISVPNQKPKPAPTKNQLFRLEPNG